MGGGSRKEDEKGTEGSSAEPPAGQDHPQEGGYLSPRLNIKAFTFKTKILS